MGSGYVYVITAVSAVAFASFAVYDSEKMKSARFTLGIILLCAMTVPLGSLIDGLSDIDFSYTGEDFSDNVVEKTLEEAFCDGIARSIREEFSIKSENITVQVLGFDSEKMRADTICVTLSGIDAAKNHGAIKKYVDGFEIGKCVLEVRFG